jgi:anti-sigma factor RsiW
MNCQKVAEKLSVFLDGELPDVQRVLVSQHLDACEPCAAEYRSLAAAWERLGELPRTEPRAHLWPRIEARLAQQTVGQRWRWLGWSSSPALATVALVVGLLLGFQAGALVVNSGASPTRAGGETDVDPLHLQYFGDVFPGSLPEAALNVSVETRTSEPGGVRR